MTKEPLTDEQLREVVAAFEAHGGNKLQAAKALGLPPQTFRNRLRTAEKRLGLTVERKVDGKIDPMDAETWSLPLKGRVARYIFTSVQNSTHLHPGWINLLAYAEWLDALPNASCKFVVGTFSYSVDAQGAKTTKLHGPRAPAYDPDIVEFIVDKRVQIAPSLMWCGEMNITPTVPRPLAGMDTYNGRASNIFPHAKIAMESVASLRSEGTKFNWTTGTITQRNYVQRKAGIVAEQAHGYGGLLAEVDHTGRWFVRQLHIDGNGHVMDIGPDGFRPLRIADGVVTEDARVDSIVWGDIHASEMAPWIMMLGWEPGGMLDTLRPKRQFMHDIFSMRSRSHHEEKDFHARYAKHVNGQESVEDEVQLTADFLNFANRPWVQTIVVPSNHDEHLDKWLNEADARKDPVNVHYYTRLQAIKLDLIKSGARDTSVLRHALFEAGLTDGVLFLDSDEPFVICRDVDGGIECSLHGHRGPGGSRGSTAALTKLGRAVIKGHDHKAAIRDNVYSVGVCAEDFVYARGPSAHSATHCVVFDNGRRQLVTMWERGYRL